MLPVAEAEAAGDGDDDGNPGNPGNAEEAKQEADGNGWMDQPVPKYYVGGEGW